MSQPSVRTDYEKRLIALQQCLHDIQSQESPSSLGSAVLTFLQEWFTFDLIWFAQYDAPSQVLAGISGILPREKDVAVLQSQQSVLAGDLFDQALLTGQIQTVTSLEKELRAGTWQAVAQRQGIQGASILPIRFRKKSHGILMVATKLWGGLSRPEEMAELKMLTGAMGAALSAMTVLQVPAEKDSLGLVNALSAVLSTNAFEDRLKQVLELIHQTIQPARTCFYRIDLDEQICSLQEVYSGPSLKRSGLTKPTVVVEVALQQINAFYQTTLQNQSVAIADVESVIHGHRAPARLMTLTQSRAWLSAPVFDRQMLVGVLVVEESVPRMWSDSDKQHLVLMSQIVSYFDGDPDSAMISFEKAHLPSLLNTLKEAEHNAGHWEKILQQCLEQVGTQFAVRWVALFHHDPEENTFECRSQFCSKRKQPLPALLPCVSDVDAKLLSRLSEPLAVQAMSEDLRFLSWRSLFLQVGMQSYILVKMSQENSLGEFLLLGADLPRTWTDRERETIVPISKAISKAVLLRSQSLSTQQQQQVMTVLNQGLRHLQQTQRQKQLFEIALESMQQLLTTEVMMILRWSPQDSTAEIAGLINQSKLEIDPAAQIVWQSDRLLQTLLETSSLKGKTSFPGLGMLRGAAHDLASNSEWLKNAEFIEVLAVPIQSRPDQPCIGLALGMNTSRKGWSALQREGLQVLARELTNLNATKETTSRLALRCETLECLNWYKQRQVEQFSQLWSSQIESLQKLLPQDTGITVSSMKNRPLPPLTQLKQAFTALDVMLKDEIWDLTLDAEVISIATLLRRSLARIESVVSARQLWTQVHNLTPSVSVNVPSQKLDLLITELLLAACYRTKVGDRVDIWCRALQDNWVEISITDQGRLNPRLVKELVRYPKTRLPTPTIESLPGLHFKVCQSLIEQIGGQLELSQLEDGRALSRIILPTAVQA